MTNNIQLNSICHLLSHKNKRGLIQALYGSYEVVAAPENAVKINVINTNKRYTKNRHLFLKISIDVISSSHHTKNKFSVKDFFNKCDQIHRKLQVWSHLLKSLMENLVFVQCQIAVHISHQLIIASKFLLVFKTISRHK